MDPGVEENLIIFISTKNIHIVHKLIYSVSGGGDDSNKMSKTGPVVGGGRLRSNNEKMEDIALVY